MDLPPQEVEYLSDDMQLGSDYHYNFIENMDDFMINHWEKLSKNCPILVKKLEMFRQQQIIYQQKLHIQEQEAGCLEEESHNGIDRRLVIPSWAQF